MTFVYLNKECGNIHENYTDMVAEAREMYDYGDPTNPVRLSDLYERVAMAD